jgi:protein-S-isoprenylcysteine O-methyltransferase Ste14
MSRIASLSPAASNLVWTVLCLSGLAWAAWVWSWDATGRAHDDELAQKAATLKTITG